MSQAVSKVCRFCQADVAARPRIKDKKGRYACQPCFERLKEKRRAEAPVAAAAAPSAAFDPDIDTESIAIALEEPAATSAPGRACPSCKAMMGAGDVFCIHCGTNVQTGGKLGKVKVKKAKKGRARKSRRGDVPLAETPIAGFISFAIAAALSFGMAFGTNSGMPPVVLSISMVMFFCYAAAVGILTLVSALKQDGVVQMLLVWFLPFYVLYWMFAKAESGLLKLNFVLVLLLYIPYFMALAHLGLEGTR